MMPSIYKISLKLLFVAVVLMTTGCSDYEFENEIKETPSQDGDDLGNHTAETDLNLNGNQLIGATGSEGIFISPTGDVGVGTLNPETKFEVNGQIKISGGAPGLGKVLTSDANGIAVWADPSATPSATASAIRTAAADPAVAVEGDVYFNTTNDTLFTYDGATWNASNDGGAALTATQVLATGIQAGTFGAGVLLPATQLTGAINPNTQIAGGTLGTGVLLPSTQITGSLNPLTQLNGGACGVNQVLLSNGTQFLCVDSSTLGTTQAESVLSSAVDPVGALEGDVYYNTGDNTLYTYDGAAWNASNDGGVAASVAAAGITAGTLGAGVLLPSAQITGSLNPLTQLNGGICGVDQILQSDGTNFSCVDGSGLADNLGNHTATTNIALGSNYLSGDGDAEGVFVDGSGNVGIGTASPDKKLIIESSSADMVEIKRSTAGGAYLWLTDGSSKTFKLGSSSSGATGKFFIQEPGGSNMVTFEEGGNVGIGTTTPTSKLEVAGQLTITGGSPGVNKVLTSDATGLASWQTLSGLPGTSDNLGDHTATQNIDLTTFKLVGNGGTNGVLISNTGVAEFENQIQINGGSPGLNKVLVSSATGLASWETLSSVPGSTIAESVLTSAIDPVGALEGDVYYNTGDNTLYTYDGAAWNASNDGGAALTATQVLATGVTAGTFGAGVLLPAAQLTGSINPNTQIAAGTLGTGVLLPSAQITGSLNPLTQLNGGICGAGEVLQSDGTNFSCQVVAGAGDNLGNHTATSNIQLGSNYLSGDGDAEGVFVDGSGNVGVGTAAPSSKLHLADTAGVTLTLEADTDNTTESDNPSVFLTQDGGTVTARFGIVGATGDIFTDSLSNATYIKSDEVGVGEHMQFATNEAARMTILSTGNVGIGTTTPGSKLEVAGQVTITGGSPGLNKVLVSDATGLATWETLAGLPGAGDDLGNHTATTNIQLGSNYLSGDGDAEGVFVDSSGNVGIGTSAPDEKLEVVGRIQSSGSDADVEVRKYNEVSSAFGANYLGLRSRGTEAAPLAINENDVMTGLYGSGFDGAAPSLYTGVIRVVADEDYSVGNHGSRIEFATTLNGSTTRATRMTIANSGNVGIGTTTPTSKLEVAGQVTITGGSPGLNKVLVSDATGLATWETLAGLPGAGDNLGNHTATTNIQLGSNYLSGDGDAEGVFVDGSGNVGIGTASPGHGLDVAEDDGQSVIRVADSQVDSAAILIVKNDATNWRVGVYGNDNDNFSIGEQSNKRITVQSSTGNVGIGTIAPTSKLEVTGQVTITGGSPGLNKVLVSDATGLAEWRTLASVPGSTIAESVLTSVTDPVGALEGDVYYNTGNDTLYTYDGALWSASNAGGVAASVPATGVTAGTFGVGVLLPAGQVTGSFNPITSLDGSVCGVGEVLQSDGTNFSCQVVAGAGDHLGNHTATTNIILGSNYLSGDGDAEGVFVDGSGNVGIGTTGPVADLDIAGSLSGYVRASGGSGEIFLKDNNATNEWSINSAENGGADSALLIQDDGATRMVIADTGNVGIGTASPLAKLSIAETGAGLQLSHDGGNNGMFLGSADANEGIIGFGVDFEVTTPAVTSWVPKQIEAGVFRGENGNFMFYGDTGLTAGTPYTPTELMRITPAGNVGIGTATPTSKLEVAGQVTITGGSPGLNKVLVSDATGLATWETLAGLPGAGDDLGDHTATTNIQLGSNYLSGDGDAEGVFVDGSGNVGVGTASPDALLDVNGILELSGSGRSHISNDTAVGREVLILRAEQNLANGSGINMYGAGDSSLANRMYFYTAGNDGTAEMIIDENGNVGIGTTSPASLLHTVGESVHFDRVAGDNTDRSSAVFYREGVLALTLGGNGADFSKIAFANGNDFSLMEGGVQRFTIESGGNVGIGTTTPTSKLEVTGQVTITGGSPGLNKVLVSDATGLATWETLAGLPGAGDDLGNHTATTNIQLGSNFLSGDGDAEGVFVDGAGNVGIGTASPGADFHITDSVGNADVRINSANSALNFLSQTSGTNWLQSGVDFTSGSSADLRFSDMSGVNTHMIIKSTGSVGIGTTSPTSELEVAGQVTITGGSPGLNKVLVSDATGLATWETLAGLPGAGDDLGDHTATTNIQLGSNYLSGDGDAEGIFINGSGDVGVGTTTPGKTLTVESALDQPLLLTSTDRYSGVLMQDSTSTVGTGGAIVAADGDELFFQTGATHVSAMRIDASGNVGIGTASPGQTLTINSESSSVEHGLSIMHKRSTAGYSSHGIFSFGSDVEHSLRVNADKDLFLQTNGVDQVYISPTGSVGVGTISPGAKLEVADSAGDKLILTDDQDGDSMQSLIRFHGDSDGSHGWMGFASTSDDDLSILAQGADGDIVLGAGGLFTKGLRILGSNGNVGIGTSAPIAPLSVGTYVHFGESGGSAATGSDIRMTSSGVISSGDSFFINIDGDNDSASNKFVVSKDRLSSTGGTDLFVVQENGDVGVGTASPSSRLHTVSPIQTATSGTYYGSRSTVTTDPTTSATGTTYATYSYSNKSGVEDKNAIVGSLSYADNNGSGAVTNLAGIRNYARNNSTGVITTARGSYNYVLNNQAGSITDAIGSYGRVNSTDAGGTITNAYGVRANVDRAAGTITNGFGVYIDNIAGTNTYGLYQSHSSDDNYFAGSVGITTNNPEVELDVNLGVINASAICDEDNTNCIDLSVGPAASAIRSLATNPAAGNIAGDVVYNTTDGVTYFYSGTAWEPMASSGDSNSVIVDANPTVNLSGASSGDIAYNSTSNELEYYNGAAWVSTAAAGGDDLGDHTATANIILGSNYLSGDGGAEGITIDSVGHVGIGHNTPDAGLEVRPTDESANDAIRTVTNISNADLLMGASGAIAAENDMYFNIDSDNDEADTRSFIFGKNAKGSGSTELMRVTEAGNVGIGTTAPGRKLSVVEEGSQAWSDVTSYLTHQSGSVMELKHARGTAAAPVLLQDGDRFGQFMGSGYSAAASNFIKAAQIRMVVDGDPDTAGDTTDMPSRIEFHTTLDGNGAMTEKMRIDNAGNVGIGTVSPTEKLNIEGTETNVIVRVDGSQRGGLILAQEGSTHSDGSFIKFINKQRSLAVNAGQVGAIRVEATSTASDTGGNMHFSTRADGDGGVGTAPVRMTITNAGNVGIGTAAPIAPLSLGTYIHFAESGGSAATGSDIRMTSSGVISSGDSFFINIDGDNDSASNKFVVSKDRLSSTGGTDLFVVQENGDVGVGTASPSSRLHTVSPIQTATSGTYYGSRSTVTTDPTAAATGVTYAAYSYSNKLGAESKDSVRGALSYADNNGSGAVASLDGIRNYARNNSTGVITTARGSYNYVLNNQAGSITDATGSYGRVNSTDAGGIITNAYGVRANVDRAAGTITNGFGVYIDNIAGTNTYGLYQSHSSDDNYFAGNVGISTSSPDVELDVGTGSINASEICDEDNTNCIDLSEGMSAIRGLATNPSSGNVEGDIVYNTTDQTTYVYNGTAWEAVASSGDSNSVIADANPTVNLSGASSGDIAYNSTSNELEYYNGAAWVSTSSTGGDDLGDHEADNNIELNGNWLSGDGANEGIFVDGSGNVGVGTAVPGSTFDIANEIIFNEGGGSTGVGPDIRMTSAGSIAAGDQMNIIIDGDNDSAGNYFRILKDSFSSTTAEELFRVQEDGKVGIGTDAPDLKLTVVGENNVFSGYDESIHILSDDGNSAGMIGTSGEAGTSNKLVLRAARGAGGIVFATNNGSANQQSMYITNTGRVSIGRPVPSYKLDVQDSRANYMARFRNADTSAGTDGIIVQAGETANPGTGSHYIRFRDGDGDDLGSIRGDGAGAVSYSVGSDVRLKKDIKDTSYSLEDLLEIKVRDYKYKTSNVERTGFIAQELYEVYPTAVNKPENDAEEMWSIDYGQVTPLLVKAVQGVVEMIKDIFGVLENFGRRILSLEEKANEIDVLKAELKVKDEQIKELQQSVSEIKEMLMDRSPASAE